VPEWIDSVPFPHVGQHKPEVCAECAAVAPVSSRHVHQGEWCAKCVEHGVAEEVRRNAALDVAHVKDALLKIDLFLYDGDTNNGGDDTLVSEASDDLHRMLACDAERPSNLSDPAAAAENSEGCQSCGEPWWAHDVALTGVSGALIDTHGSTDIAKWTRRK
jgi:hypothetical protein